jgi:hypothetical protein
VLPTVGNEKRNALKVLTVNQFAVFRKGLSGLRKMYDSQVLKEMAV